MDFPGASVVKNLSVMQETREMWVGFLGCEDPLEEGVATDSSILPWRIPMNRGTWWATVHKITKSRMQLKRLSSYAHTAM